MEEKQLKTLHFTRSASRGTVTTEMVYVNVLERNYYISDDMMFPLRLSLNRENYDLVKIENIEEFNVNLKKIEDTVSKWEDKYSIPGIVYDGFSWHLYLNYVDGTMIEKNGFCKFPENYGEFEKTLEKILDLGEKGKKQKMRSMVYGYCVRNIDDVRRDK